MASLLTVSNALSLLQPLLEGAVAFSLWRRKAHKEFPYFFAYLLAQIAMFCVLFPISNWASAGFMQRYWYYLNWGTTAIGIALLSKVLHEISMDVFRPFSTLKDLGTVLFRWAALVMLLVGVVVAASATSNILRVQQALDAVERCLFLAQTGLALFLLMFASHLRLRWHHRSFGFALGFGFMATAQLIMGALLLNGTNYVSDALAWVILPSCYDIALLIWLGYCWVDSPVSLSESTRVKTQRWDRGLTEIQHPESAESLIPMFVSMVERALARSSAKSPSEEPVLVERGVARG